MPGGSDTMAPGDLRIDREEMKAIVKEAIRELLQEPLFATQALKPLLPNTAELVSHFTSASYMRTLPGYDGVKMCASWSYLFDEVFEKYISGEPGFIIEAGTASGSSINYMSSLRPDAPFYGFDSFEGLPEAWHGHPAGAYTRKGALSPGQSKRRARCGVV